MSASIQGKRYHDSSGPTDLCPPAQKWNAQGYRVAGQTTPGSTYRCNVGALSHAERARR